MKIQKHFFGRVKLTYFFFSFFLCLFRIILIRESIQIIIPYIYLFFFIPTDIVYLIDDIFIGSFLSICANPFVSSYQKMAVPLLLANEILLLDLANRLYCYGRFMCSVLVNKKKLYPARMTNSWTIIWDPSSTTDIHTHMHTQF